MARVKATGEQAVKRLKRGLMVFVVAITMPGSLLFLRAYEQVQWEAFHTYRGAAETLLEQIDAELGAMVLQEQARSFDAYRYRQPNAAGSLSSFPVDSALPGIVAYFQISPDGELTSPLLPIGANSDSEQVPDQRGRDALLARMRAAFLRTSRQIAQAEGSHFDAPASLDEGDLALATLQPEAEAFAELIGKLEPAESASQVPQASYGNVAELKLDSTLAKKSAAREFALAPKRERAESGVRSSARQVRKERVTRSLVLPQAAAPASADFDRSMVLADDIAEEAASLQSSAGAAIRQGVESTPVDAQIRWFESELGPMHLRLLDDRYFVLFRDAWRDERRYVQGALLERAALLDQLVERYWQLSELATFAGILIAWQDEVIALQSPDERDTYELTSAPGGEELYRARMSAPFSAFEFIVTAGDVPTGDGARYILWVSLALSVVLIAGCITIYRFGVGQIQLAQQQRDFISAVSHELKTPLTSIRMYSEMLKAGWVDDERRSGYYTFIHDESERLSRLINNVLELARLDRGKREVQLETVAVTELAILAREKLTSQVTAAGFELELHQESAADDCVVKIDKDSFIQILINLTDNAIKFTPDAAEKRITLSFERSSDNVVRVVLRDRGHGIPAPEIKRIFELFYRGDDEMTRESVGTGIGLALVRQLAAAMHARVDVRNANPGAEFILELPCTEVAAGTT